MKYHTEMAETFWKRKVTRGCLGCFNSVPLSFKGRFYSLFFFFFFSLFYAGQDSCSRHVPECFPLTSSMPFIFFCGGLRDISRFGICGDCLKTNTSLNESPCDLVLYFSEEISLSSSLMKTHFPVFAQSPSAREQQRELGLPTVTSQTSQARFMMKRRKIESMLFQILLLISVFLYSHLPIQLLILQLTSQY